MRIIYLSADFGQKGKGKVCQNVWNSTGSFQDNSMRYCLSAKSEGNLSRKSIEELRKCEKQFRRFRVAICSTFWFKFGFLWQSFFLVIIKLVLFLDYHRNDFLLVLRQNTRDMITFLGDHSITSRSCDPYIHLTLTISDSEQESEPFRLSMNHLPSIFNRSFEISGEARNDPNRDFVN
jgi:hypothetical protein